MFNLWKPLIPAGQTGTWAPVIVKSAGHIVKQAWYCLLYTSRCV